jgi:hypothetical protein
MSQGYNRSGDELDTTGLPAGARIGRTDEAIQSKLVSQKQQVSEKAP